MAATASTPAAAPPVFVRPGHLRVRRRSRRLGRTVVDGLYRVAARFDRLDNSLDVFKRRCRFLGGRDRFGFRFVDCGLRLD